MKNMSKPRGIAKNRFSVSIPQGLEDQIAELKKEQYFDKPRSEMIRFLIRKGLEAVVCEQANQKD